METIVKASTIYTCSLERAFKTPLLCDVTKVHTGFGVMPKVTHCTDDEMWGKVGGSKKIYAAKSWTQKGGFISMDTVLERIENSYWKFEVSDFQSWMLGFSKFTGEWKTTQLEPTKILIDYTYTLTSKNAILAPLNWIFAKTFWKMYMNRVLKIVQKLAHNKEPYMYN
jgi:hypothetical protein